MRTRLTAFLWAALLCGLVIAGTGEWRIGW